MADKRWTVYLEYKTDKNHQEVYEIEEISELQSIIEDLEDWNTIKHFIHLDIRYNHKEIN